MRAGHFTSLMCLLIFVSGCSLRVRDDLWSHCVFSAAASGAVTAATGDCVEGAVVALSLGLLKEVYDAFRGSGFSLGDIAADLVGSLTGAVGAKAAMEGSFCSRR